MTNTAEPRDAAAVVLTRGDEICWARRSLKLNFLGGWHAFPGGKLEKSDSLTVVENCSDPETSALIACAARECFEETGILLAQGGDKMTKGQRASLHDDLMSERMTFAEILAHWELRIDGNDFIFVGAWTTPSFSPVRFKTRFFLVNCPPKQEPYAATGELETVEFIRAKDAWEKWTRGEILCAPPIFYTIQTFFAFSKGLYSNPVPKLLTLAADEGENPRQIRFNPHVAVFPLKTWTLPPATHTNCFIVGRQEFVVIDAASPFAEEQIALHKLIDSLVEENNGTCQAIIVSHLHPDHTGGETALQKHLLEKHNQKVPLATHTLTAEKLPNIKFDRFLEDGEIFNLFDANGELFQLETLHAPGHARGHLCFYDQEIGFLLSSDNVVGAGSILIAPPEGNMIDYLNSLERLGNLPDLRFLCGSHGAAIANAKEKVESYIAHRFEREQKILEAWNAGAQTTTEIVERVYTDIKPELRQLAEKSVLAHLEKLQIEQKI